MDSDFDEVGRLIRSSAGVSPYALAYGLRQYDKGPDELIEQTRVLSKKLNVIILGFYGTHDLLLPEQIASEDYEKAGIYPVPLKDAGHFAFRERIWFIIDSMSALPSLRPAERTGVSIRNLRNPNAAAEQLLLKTSRHFSCAPACRTI